MDDDTGEAYVDHRMGQAYLRLGDLDRAAASLRHALALTRQVNEAWLAEQVCHTLAEVALARGDLAAADAHLTEASSRFDEVRMPLWQASARILHAPILLAHGEHVAAEHALAEAEGFLTANPSRRADHLSAQLARVRAESRRM